MADGRLMRPRRPLSLEDYGAPTTPGDDRWRRIGGFAANPEWRRLAALSRPHVNVEHAPTPPAASFGPVWAVSLDPLKSASRELRRDMLRAFVGGHLDADGAKGLS